jgi:hypothetical protein
MKLTTYVCKGIAPKKPVKKRAISIVWISFETAVPKQKQAATKYEGKIATFLPYASESGAQRTGPKPKSKRNKVSPRGLTTSPTSNSSAIVSIGTEYM